MLVASFNYDDSGAASPMAIVVKKSTMIAGGCANAKPRAGARNGAVQGVASAVARTPLKNAPAGRRALR